MTGTRHRNSLTDSKVCLHCWIVESNLSLPGMKMKGLIRRSPSLIITFTFYFYYYLLLFKVLKIIWEFPLWLSGLRT